MPKVSSNAGKHPYLRPENASFFVSNNIEKKGLPFKENLIVKFKVNIETDYCDKKKNVLSYLDIVTFKNEDYKITYDSKEYRWIMENLNDSKKVEILQEKAHLAILKKKYN